MLQTDKRVVKYEKKSDPGSFWIFYFTGNGDFEAEREIAKRDLLSNFGLWYVVRKHLMVKPWPVNDVWKAIDTEVRKQGYDLMTVLRGFLTGARAVLKVNGLPIAFADDITGFSVDGSTISNQSDQWKKDGKCPQCGELGPYVHCQATCSKHGPY
jgi:hypothetical protein